MPELDPRDDLPHTPADVPLWSENYMFCGYDRNRNIGFYHHLGTLPHDPRQWGALFCAVLPGDELLVAKDYGRGEVSKGPASPSMSFVCQDPMQRWLLQKDGMGVAAHHQELRHGLLTDRAPIPVRFNAEFRASAPAWDMGARTNTPAFHTHHQQAGTVSGSVQVGERHLEFAGSGYRDHSVGPRDVRGLTKHVWFHAWMPSGRVLQGLSMEGAGGVTWSAGYIFDGTDLVDVEVTSAPAWTGGNGDPGPFSVSLANDGIVSTASGETVRSIPWTLESPNEILLGQDHTMPGALLSYSAFSTWRWDGEEGVGLLEMSSR